jgi:hypothetical protein
MNFLFLPRIALRGLRAGAVLARCAAALPINATLCETAPDPTRSGAALARSGPDPAPRGDVRDDDRLRRALWKGLARPENGPDRAGCILRS